MWNVATKFITAAAVAILVACSSGHSPQQLFDDAKAAYDRGDTELALTLSDSLSRDKQSPVELRRQAMHLHALAMEQQVETEIAANDSLMLALQAQADSLQTLMRYVDNPMEGFFVPSAGDKAPKGQPSLMARVSRDHQLYIMSTTDKPLTHTTIAVSSGNERATTSAIPRDGERNSLRSGIETVYYIGTDADTIGRFIAEHRGKPLTLHQIGTASDSTELPAVMATALADAWQYSYVARRLKLAILTHEKLERMLAVARNQVAKTAPDTQE